MKKKWMILTICLIVIGAASSFAQRASAVEAEGTSHGAVTLQKSDKTTKPPTEGGTNGNNGANGNAGSNGNTAGGKTGSTSGGKTFLPQLGEMAKGISTVIGTALIAFVIFLFWKKRKDEEKATSRKR